MPTRVQQPTEEEKRVQLCVSIRQIFEQAGNTAANHKKNYVVLYKVHQEFACYVEYLKKGKRELVKLTGEKQFQDTFKHLLTNVLPLKKGETTGDRIIKFIGGYIRHINEQVPKKEEEDENSEKEEDEDEENPTASRFTAHLLHWLFDGFLAKDKNVRFRVLQTVAEMIAHLGAIDEDDYKRLRTALIDRLNDKEPVVRYQAAISLAKLCGTEDASELADGESSILDILLHTMAQDESADVRRAVLINIPIEQDTLPAILDRSRDTDTNMRKAVYDSVLGKNVLQASDENLIGPAHPRALSIQQRELIVKNGLGDREPTVRAVAANLLATWIDVADVDSDADDRSGTGVKDHFESKLLAFLNLFDLNEGEVATNALSSIFQAKANVIDNIEFDDAYWTNLSPERAFLARVFFEHCKETQDNVRLEAALPVVTAIAFRTQEWYNLLQDEEPLSQDLDEGQIRRREDEIASKEIVVAELLKLAVNLDYSDEIGRRKMFDLVRGMLRQETLPLRLMAPCIDVLRELSATERDLIRLVVEIVQELRDSGDNEDAAVGTVEEDQKSEETQRPISSRKPMEDMTLEQKNDLDKINLRCLSLCQMVLERVNGTFEENIMLDGILKELIVPSVQRKDEIFRELGVKCLGLCCLIARRLAVQTIQLLMNMMASAPHPVKIALAYSVFDIFLVHEGAILKHQDNNTEALTTFLLHHIEHEQDPVVKAIFCKGTCKLILPGMITDVNAVKNLIKVFISPTTIDNQELRQCLTYFLLTYSHSSASNQKRMREIFIHIFLDICQDRKEAETEDEIISSQQVAEMFVYWTNPVELSKAMLARPGGRAINETEEAVHLDLVADILKILFEKDLKVTIEKEDKRILCQILNKIHIPDIVDDYKICSIKLLIDHLRVRRPLKDSASNTALSKFESTIAKKFEKQLEHFTEEEFRKLEELNELFEFLDSIIPLDDDELPEADPPKRGRKRRSESAITSTNTEVDSYPGSLPPEARKGKRKSKRPRLSSEGDGEDNLSTRSSMLPPKVPARNLPRRAAAARKPVEVIVISDDDEDEPFPSKPASRPQPSVKEEEAQLDRDISALLRDNSVATASARSYDSIMGPDSEGEADEVNDLLANE